MSPSSSTGHPSIDAPARSSAERTARPAGPCPVCRADGERGRRQVFRAGTVAICGTCGSWFREPRPEFDELVRIYDQDYYKAWGLDVDATWATLTKRATFSGILQEAGRAVRCRPDVPVRILDVGAATGMLLEVAQERSWEPYALELNPYSAGVLRQKFGADRVFEGELTACTFAPASFDLVTMTDLIEHVLDIPGTLGAAARLLKPDGVICITTPRIDSLSRLIMGRNWLHFKEEHIQYFSRRGLRQSLEDAGFGDIAIRAHAKRLTYDYLHRQLSTYPHWLLSPIVRLGYRLLPSAARRRTLAYRCGEMLVLGRLQAQPTAAP